MARPTGDPFPDAVYDAIPLDETVYVPDMTVAYGVPFEPETWPAAAAERPRGFRAGPLGQVDEAKNVRNALIVFGIVAAVAIPAAGYLIYREQRGR
jgi:hypothetical protein